MLNEILNFKIYGNAISNYAISILYIIVIIILVWILKKTIIKFLKYKAKKTETDLDDIFLDRIEKKVLPSLYFIAIYLSIKQLIIAKHIEKIINTVFVLIVAFYIVRLCVAVIRRFFEKKIQYEISESKINLYKALIPAANIVVWVLALYIVFDNLGIKITPVIAGLGLGGLAVALAAQSILGDLFAYFIMIFDRPFELGDFIILDGDYKGTVEKIGVKSTRLRSLNGEMIVIANTDLINARVRNYKKMNQRRVLFVIGVLYETSYQKLEKIPEIIKGIFAQVDGASLDRVHFASFGDFSLNYEIVYYVNSNDYNKYMDIQQEVNLKIFKEFEKYNIEFAYPTNTVYVKQS